MAYPETLPTPSVDPPDEWGAALNTAVGNIDGRLNTVETDPKPALWQPLPLADRFLPLCALNGAPLGTVEGVADRIDVAFCPPRRDELVFDQLVADVMTGQAAAQGRIVVYSCSDDGWPFQLVYESATLDFSTAGAKPGAGFTFAAGTPYWVGVHHGGTATMRSLGVSALTPFNSTAGTGANVMACVLRATATFAGGAPAFFDSPVPADNVPVPIVRGTILLL